MARHSRLEDILTRVFRANMASGSSWLPPDALERRYRKEVSRLVEEEEVLIWVLVESVLFPSIPMVGRECFLLLSGAPWGRVTSVAVAGGGGVPSNLWMILRGEG